jgi:TonB family protein
MRYLVALLLVGLIGCSTPYEIARDIEPPELISYAPLPPFHPLPLNRVLKLRVLVCVREDGSVEHARLVTSSGDVSWDSLAEQSIMQWRYAPPLRNGVPTDVWVHQQIVVQFDDPILVPLSQLCAYNQSQADSLYSLLINGVDFETLVRQFAGGVLERGGFLGTVDIRTFAPRVREALKSLHEGEFTHPLRVGNKFVMFKRVKKMVS